MISRHIPSSCFVPNNIHDGGVGDEKEHQPPGHDLQEDDEWNTNDDQDDDHDFSFCSLMDVCALIR